MSITETRQVTLRLPEPLYSRIKQLAEHRRVSVNQLAQESFELLSRQALAEEMRAAYDALGDDTEAADVEYLVPAALEVIDREHE